MQANPVHLTNILTQISLLQQVRFIPILQKMLQFTGTHLNIYSDLVSLLCLTFVLNYIMGKKCEYYLAS